MALESQSASYKTILSIIDQSTNHKAQLIFSWELARALDAFLVNFLPYKNTLEQYGHFDHLAPSSTKEAFVNYSWEVTQKEIEELNKKIKTFFDAKDFHAYTNIYRPWTQKKEALKEIFQSYQVEFTIIGEGLARRTIYFKKRLVLPNWVDFFAKNIIIFRPSLQGKTLRERE